MAFASNFRPIYFVVTALTSGFFGLAQADYVVGTGEVASCTQAELMAGLAAGGKVTFNCGPMPAIISLGAGYFPEVSKDTTVDGGYGITIDGAGRRIFEVKAALTLRNISLVNGEALSNSRGGAVWVAPAPASLEVQRVNFEDNKADAGGAAIWSEGGDVKIESSTFSGHETAITGLGAVGSDSAVVTVTNSTFQGFGEVHGVVAATGSAHITLNHSTVVVGSGGNSGLFASQNGIIDVLGSIVFSKGSPVCSVIGAGSINDQGGNLRWGGNPPSACTTFINADPKLGNLASNGGPTRTMELGAGSPAISGDLTSSCPSKDQRGAPRSIPCDIGAFEHGAAPVEYSVGGSLMGMVSGSAGGVWLSLNGGPAMLVSSNGSFGFMGQYLSAGTPYVVTVTQNPIAPAQTCTVTNGAGVMADLDVTNVQVTCVGGSAGGGVAGVPILNSWAQGVLGGLIVLGLWFRRGVRGKQ